MASDNRKRIKLGLEEPPDPIKSPPLKGARFGRQGEAGPGTGLEQSSDEPFQPSGSPDQSAQSSQQPAAAGIPGVQGAAGKQPQETVGYQRTPGFCASCSHYQEPNQCELVDGVIDAGGYCQLFSSGAGAGPDMSGSPDDGFGNPGSSPLPTY